MSADDTPKTSTETAVPVEGGVMPAEDPIATIFAGFGEFTDSGIGKLALVGCKLLLFNVFLWGPIAARGYMIFFW